MRIRMVVAAALLTVGLAVHPALGTGPGTPGPSNRTTLGRTIVHPSDSNDSKDLAFGPGQRRVTRTLHWRDPGGKGRALAGFKQVSDVHAIDEESPGRVEYFDECGTPFVGAYRVQEALSTQVGNSMLKRLRSIKTGPATGTPLRFTISTGDNVDNNQLNEARWFIRLLNGQTVNPNSGAESYDGYTREQFSQALDDDTLALAQQPFDSVGAGRWYVVFGNHDGLIQGNLSANGAFDNIVMGDKKVFLPIEGFADCPDDPNDLGGVATIVLGLLGTSSRTVPPDATRHFVNHDELVDAYLKSSGKPRGHGLRSAPIDPLFDSRAGYYSFPIAEKVRGISMDTITGEEGPDGHVDDPQFEWLERQLKKYSRHYYSMSGKRRRNPGGNDRLIVLFSHHSSVTLNSPGNIPEGAPYHCFRKSDAPNCEEGIGLHRLLRRFPNVIAWVNGHEHNNVVRAYPARKKQDPARGFWEINTAAHIDWPQQSRLIEIAYQPGTKADTVIIYGTIVDHGAAPDPTGSQSDPDRLASISRREAYFDACVRVGQADCAAGGTMKDRNVRLIEKAPFDLGP